MKGQGNFSDTNSKIYSRTWITYRNTPIGFSDETPYFWLGKWKDRTILYDMCILKFDYWRSHKIQISWIWAKVCVQKFCIFQLLFYLYSRPIFTSFFFYFQFYILLKVIEIWHFYHFTAFIFETNQYFLNYIVASLVITLKFLSNKFKNFTSKSF